VVKRYKHNTGLSCIVLLNLQYSIFFDGCFYAFVRLSSAALVFSHRYIPSMCLLAEKGITGTVDELVKSTCELHSGSVLSMDLWLLLVIVLWWTIDLPMGIKGVQDLLWVCSFSCIIWVYTSDYFVWSCCCLGTLLSSFVIVFSFLSQRIVPHFAPAANALKA